MRRASRADMLADRLLGVGGREAEPAEAVLKGFDSDAFASGFRGPAGPAFARSGSQGDAGVCCGWTDACWPRARRPTRACARSIRRKAR